MAIRAQGMNAQHPLQMCGGGGGGSSLRGCVLNCVDKVCVISGALHDDAEPPRISPGDSLVCGLCGKGVYTRRESSVLVFGILRIMS